MHNVLLKYSLSSNSSDDFSSNSDKSIIFAAELWLKDVNVL